MMIRRRKAHREEAKDGHFVEAFFMIFYRPDHLSYLVLSSLVDVALAFKERENGRRPKGVYAPLTENSPSSPVGCKTRIRLAHCWSDT